MCLQTLEAYFEAADQQNEISAANFKILNEDEVRSYYKRYIKPREKEIFNIADMTPLSKASFKKSLVDLSQVYERDINNHIEELTKIMDTTTSEKTFAEQKRIAQILKDKF